MIKGVKTIPILTHKDNRGFFREVFRFQEQFADISIGQLSHSVVNQGIIKGWHGHEYQSQWNYVIQGSAKVVLKDVRKDSATYGLIQRIQANEENPIGYFFPAGVLHGYFCEKGPMHIIYVTSGTYDLCDEIRIDDNELYETIKL